MLDPKSLLKVLSAVLLSFVQIGVMGGVVRSASLMMTSVQPASTVADVDVLTTRLTTPNYHKKQYGPIGGIGATGITATTSRSSGGSADGGRMGCGRTQ